MPTQVLPITDLAKAGVIMDTPAVSLPPNVFSDCRNVRFRDGAIRKMEGEQEIQFNIGPSNMIFVAYWPEPSLAPDNGYIALVGRKTPDATDIQDLQTYHGFSAIDAAAQTEVDIVYLFRALDPMTRIRQTFAIPVYENTAWQHTLFGGGTTLILNNRTEKPIYVTGPIELPINEADIRTQVFFDLPGWDSYLVDERVTSFFYDPSFITDDGTDLGVLVNLLDPMPMELPAGFTTTNDQDIIVTVIPADTRILPFQRVATTYGTTQDGFMTLNFLPASATTTVTFAAREFGDPNDPTLVTQQGVLAGDSITIRIRTEPEIQVRAGVLRTYGDLLIAGNLTEMTRPTDRMGNAQNVRTVRNMPGVIRTSDVAAPGSVPANWNPFKTGVNTSDEFTLSSTGIIQDIVELQGILYVYTNESIHSVQATGNPTVPFNIRPVARGWGAQTIDAVQEFDGKHLVIGSNDIYVFGGHPGSIQSIADMRVRRFFFEDLDERYEQRLFTLLYRRRDEIWINYPSVTRPSDPVGQCTRTLVWNYRNNTWTVRDQSSFWNGVTTPIQPVLNRNESGLISTTLDPNQFYPMLVSTKTVATTESEPDSLFIADADGKFSTSSNGDYTSYVERVRLAMTPEFTTENLLSVAMLTEGLGAMLEVIAVGTDTPSAEADFSMGISNTFDVTNDYKVDLREHGRLLNHRITDNGGRFRWAIAGLQFDIGSGGTR